MQKKNRWHFCVVTGYVVMILPVLLYNIINWKAFQDISAIKFAFSFLIALSMIGLAALTKMKNKSGVWLLAVGCILAFMSELALQIGYSMLIIGGCSLFDNLIIRPITLKYKEEYYAQSGKTITYTREL